MTFRLGRKYVPDDRDFRVDRIHPAHAAAPLPPSALWADAAVLDQGDTGTCVGHGWAGWGDSAPVVDSFVEKDALAIYYEATCLDGACDSTYQNGSTVRSGAKAMQNRKRLSAYAFLATLDEIREWLANHGPVVIGADWTNDMFNPDDHGYIRPTGGVAGGHCFLLIGYDGDTFRFRNSWGKGWGLAGDFLMASADFQTILTGISDPGEACAAEELPSAPSPVPPTPSGCLDAADKALFAAVSVWMLARHSGANRLAAKAVQAWAKAKGLA